MASLKIPESTSTVEVSIIDTTFRIRGTPSSYFFGPDLKGFETFQACAYAFLITHTDTSTGKQRRIIFDLGPPKDWEHDLPDFVVDMVKQWDCDIEISKYVSEFLQESGIPLESIEAVVWSHAHWDHVGRPSLFPPSVNLIVGPGIRDAYYPGYPTVPTSTILEREFKDRKLVTLDFTTSDLTIGGFRAIDFFADGSFYFLSAPGHAIGHVNGLARTTATASAKDAQSTFILMGADSYHHGSQLRPSPHIPLPDNIPGPLTYLSRFGPSCPGHVFDVCHPSHASRRDEIPSHYTAEIAEHHNDPKTTPYFTISSTADGKTVAADLQTARSTIQGLQPFDGDENVLLIAAHDYSLYEVLNYYPKPANEWKTKGWKEKGRWRFLDDLHAAVDIASQSEA